MMNSKQFLKYLQEPDSLNDGSVVELEQLIKQYPFFQTAHLVYLQSLKKINKKLVDEKLPTESLYVADRKILFNLLADKATPEVKKAEVKKEPVKTEKQPETKTAHITVTKTVTTKTEEQKTETAKETKPAVELKTEVKTEKTAEKTAEKKKLSPEERKTNHENLVKDFFGIREENNYQTVATNIAEDGSITSAAATFAKEENVSQAVVIGEKKTADTILDKIASLRKEKEEVKQNIIKEEQAAQKAKEEKEKEEVKEIKKEEEKKEEEKKEIKQEEKSENKVVTTTVVTETVTTTTTTAPAAELSAAEKLLARLKQFKSKDEEKADLIDKFLEESPHLDRNKEVSEGDMGQDSLKQPELYSEKLAKLYITQKLYDKAIASYENLLSKYPDKKSYFEEKIKEINNLKNNQ